MKKPIALLLLLLVLLFLSGCSKSGSENAVGAAGKTTAETKPLTVTLTFPEGYTALEIAGKLEENGVCSEKDFMEAVKNSAYAQKFGFLDGMKNTDERAFLLEGYVFPDTYEFYTDESAESVLARFLRNTQSKITEEMKEKAKKLGYSMDEIITLASIIQSEAGIVNEMGKVSSVLHNRLESADYGMLQCDVTINYVNENILTSPYIKGDKTRFSEYYNTYKKGGLPVGAICNPGADAINAALEPEKTDYFFFVTDKDWNYYYASTYEEHLNNCKICGIEL